MDHPRACGEQSNLISPVSMVQGSPPRVRGTVGRAHFFRLIVRITPARAGNSGPIGPWIPCSPDHPRACGEQMPPCGSGIWATGSPPRVRGTALCSISGAAAYRITPARAGNSPPFPPVPPPNEDHPRACGEQLRIELLDLGPVGSPPRVRGTGREMPVIKKMSGITPARAGNSTFEAGRQRPAGDHPRACGEQRDNY